MAGISLLLLRGQRLHRQAGADLLQVAGDDLVAGADAGEHGDLFAVDRTERDGRTLDLVAVADDIDDICPTGLSPPPPAGPSARPAARSQQPRPHVLARQQREILVLDRRARRDRAGRGIDRIVDEGQLALVLRLRWRRAKDFRLDRPDAPRLLNLRKLRLARVERDVDRIELNDGVERRARAVDQRADRRPIASDAARERARISV